jgi:hypothetical protein
MVIVQIMHLLSLTRKFIFIVEYSDILKVDKYNRVIMLKKNEILNAR